ncbi:sensor domain-containing protein [Hyphomicrobium sp. DMF-1]|jgi:diguanylate cyclase (GGDEF)-like protein/PAS domain S-box-containing protein|uniref:sensor domain-containing protein n=1 Tax=Hyphomicrobium sp. DMF-1 TaxID=3019544 RepID=UPI0022EBF8E7|nr:diguanylate cyclase [Hyphomicrobium sp. DMF-1]WBT40267.1 diguanylate cyclase [Hyphomicrobium sp. DMF-1]
MTRTLRLPTIPKELVGLTAQIALTIFVVELFLLMAMRTQQGAPASVIDHLWDAAFVTVVSAPLMYFWIVRPFVNAALAANAELQKVARTLDDALQAKSIQAEAHASALARLKLQRVILDRLAILSETDVRGTITEVNDNFCKISGYSRDELIGRTHSLVNSGLHPKSFWTEMFATMARGEVWQGDVRNRAKDGSYYWVHCINSAVRNADGKLKGYMSLRMDITEIKTIQAKLHDQNVKLDAALKHMSQGLVMFDDEQCLVMCNEQYAKMYGLPAQLCVPGTPLADVINNHVITDIYRDGMPADYLPERVAGIAHLKESVHALSNGNSIAVVRSPMPEGGWVSTHEDITHRLRLEDRITHLALHDGLTDLPNRTLLRDRLDHALAKLAPGDSVSVLYLDLDRFKQVNDTLGHAVGDALLKAVAERIRACIRKTDTVARIGGDEFIVVQVSADAIKDAAVLSERFIDELSAPYEVKGNTVSIGVSIGIAIAPRDGANQEQLLHNADLALYRSKASGRGTYHFYEPDMADRASEQASAA